jgi:hypothetical protein
VRQSRGTQCVSSVPCSESFGTCRHGAMSSLAMLTQTAGRGSARGARRGGPPKGWRRGRRPQDAGFRQRRCPVRARPNVGRDSAHAAARVIVSHPRLLPLGARRRTCPTGAAARAAMGETLGEWRHGEGERVSRASAKKRHDSRWALFWKCFTALSPAQAMVEDSMLRSSSVRSPHPCSLHGA